MRPEKDSSTQAAYSPFWAIFVVFVIFIFLQSVTLQENFARRDVFIATQAQLQQSLAKATDINQMVDDVGRDILDLSARSEEARKIVAEHHIKLNAAQ